MTSPTPDSGSADRIADRLRAARSRRFVGRQREIERFRAALDADEPSVALFYLHGPGGVGKTSLLDAVAQLAEQQRVPIIRVDGRDVDPSPIAFQRALGTDGNVQTLPPRFVLLIDTYEQLAPLDAWLRETLLPSLPARSLTVIAGRNPPAAAWRTDAGWGELLHVIPVRNFRPEEAETYLHARGVPAEHHEALLTATYGHPLALSLAADLMAHSGGQAPVRPTDDPDMVRVLLERFIQQAPSSLHRQALAICAHVRVTTEGLLAHALGAEQAGELFAWLRGLSFIAQGPHGLYPHDLARDVLEADLRWRAPDDYLDVHRRVRQHIVDRLRTATRPDQQHAASFDLMYLHRNSPVLQPVIQWTALGTAYAEVATPDDHRSILDMVRAHEGGESAAIAEYWLHRQPQSFVAFRASGRSLIGFVASLALHEISPEDRERDPAVQAAWDFAVHQAPLRGGEGMLHHRFSMGESAYQTASEAQDMVIMTTTSQWLTTPRLAWCFIAVADRDYWEELLAYVNFTHAPEAGFDVGDRHYSVFTHDWRAQSPLAWLDVMAERELATHLTLEHLRAAQPAPLLVLSHPQFQEAVRQALRDYRRPDALRGNPLMRSRLVAAHAGADADPAALVELLDESIATLRSTPKDDRLYRALNRTYLAPAASQEQAAEALGLPFSTYRYHLTTGIDRITDWLWRQELDSAS